MQTPASTPHHGPHAWCLTCRIGSILWLTAGPTVSRVPCERQAAEGGPSVPLRAGGAAGCAGTARGKGAGAVLRASNGRVYPKQCAPSPLSFPDPLRAAGDPLGVSLV